MKKFLLLLLFWPVAAWAALSPAALNSAGIRLPPNARLPLQLSAADLSGKKRTFATALGGRRGFVLFADYTCKTLCGPALVLLTSALAQGGLAPDSWRLLVIGIDPKDSATDARRMMLAEVPGKLRAQTTFLLPESKTVAEASAALGFSYVYDKSVDQFAHPEVAYAVAADGRVLRVLSPLTLTTEDIRTVFSGPPETSRDLYGRFRVLCYRFGVLSGIYDAPVETALKVVGVLTILFMLGGFLLLLSRKRPGWT